MFAHRRFSAGYNTLKGKRRSGRRRRSGSQDSHSSVGTRESEASSDREGSFVVETPPLPPGAPIEEDALDDAAFLDPFYSALWARS